MKKKTLALITGLLMFSACREDQETGTNGKEEFEQGFPVATFSVGGMTKTKSGVT